MDEKQNQIAGIYAEIDTIFDTRLATIAIFEKAFTQVNNSNIDFVKEALDAGYYTRLIDSFPGISQKSFKELYSLRDRDTLMSASLTCVIDIIVDAIAKMNTSGSMTPFSNRTKLFVNLYPYNLPEEDKRAILSSLIIMTSDSVDIELINLSSEELTPSYCEHNFCMMIKYNDYDSWLDIHAKNDNLKNTPLTGVTILVPELYLVRLPNETELEQFRKDKTTPFRSTETYLSAIAGISFMPLEHWCADIDKMKT